MRSLLPPFQIAPSCTALELMGVPMGDDGVALLASLLPSSPQLQRLELTMVGMGAAGGSYLADALVPRRGSSGRSSGGGGGSKLTALKIETCGLGDEGAQALAGALAGTKGSFNREQTEPVACS